MKHYIVLGIAIVSGILAFALQHAHMSRLENEMGLRGQTLEVVAAREGLFVGQELTEMNMVKRTIMAEDKTGREILWEAASVRRLLGVRVTVDVPANGPILTTYLDLSNSRGSAFANIVPRGSRAVTISVDSISGVANLIRPNDRVDVLGTFRFPPASPESPYEMLTMTVMENVTVLAVDRMYSGSNSSVARSYTNVSLAVDPEYAEFLVFAQEKGKLTLTLRNPDDADHMESFRSVDFKYLESALKREAREPGAVPAPRGRQP